jgi:hypothetical protein
MTTVDLILGCIGNAPLPVVPPIADLIPEERPIKDSFFVSLNRGNGPKEFYAAVIDRVANHDKDGNER